MNSSTTTSICGQIARAYYAVNNTSLNWLDSLCDVDDVKYGSIGIKI